MLKRLSLIAILAATPAAANTVSSIDCSLSTITITFASSVAANDVTGLKISNGASAKIKYDLSDALPGTVSSNVYTVSPSSSVQDEMKKVAPWDAYIAVTGASIDSGAACN